MAATESGMSASTMGVTLTLTGAMAGRNEKSFSACVAQCGQEGYVEVLGRVCGP